MEDNSFSLLWNKPFALLSTPGQQNFEVFLQREDGRLSSERKNGWHAERFDAFDNRLNVHSVTKEEYLSSLEHVIRMLQQGDANKVVFSRCENVPAPNLKFDDIFSICKALRSTYPDACIYAHMPTQDIIWLGATPELLLRKENNRYYTVALAGTRKIEVENIAWGEKEIREQQVVTDFIIDAITRNGALDITCSDPYTSKAGKIEHIKTDIAFTSELSVDFWLKALHPTPAVSGLPQAKALSIIQQTEEYNREYYAGCFGKIGENDAEIYVHLRCAKLDLANKTITYFAGGGIMPDSSPILEWQETMNKMNTLKEVITKLI